MAAWPGTLPDFSGELNYSQQNNVLRTKLDGGPDKLRKRFSNTIISVSLGQWPLTKTEVDALETFYKTTLNGGVDSFTYTDPISGSTVNFRFVSRPSYSLIRAASSASDRLWNCNLELEIIP